MRPRGWPRRWFTQLASYTYEDNYLYGGGDNEVNYDYARPLVTGSNGASLQLDWNVRGRSISPRSPPTRTITSRRSTTKARCSTCIATPAASGTTTSSGARSCASTATWASYGNYQTGLYYLKVHNVADYRREWGNDAGAWFASAAQYNRLDRAVNPTAA